MFFTVPDRMKSVSAWMAYQMKSKGFTKVYALKGGWHEWFRNKYPVVER